MIHRLKCWEENFDAIVAGKKTAEARVEEASQFRVGDQLELRRTTHTGQPTQPECRVLVEVTHIDRAAGPLELAAMDHHPRGGRLTYPIAVMSFKTPGGFYRGRT